MRQFGECAWVARARNTAASPWPLCTAMVWHQVLLLPMVFIIMRRAACVNSCQEISDLDVRQNNDALVTLQQTMGWVKQLVRWLALGVPLQPPPLGDPLSACAGASMLVVAAIFVVLTGRLYVKEALDRCRVWQDKHPRTMLHPPAARLQHMLVAQVGCVGAVVVVLIAAWCTLMIQ